MVAAIIQIYLLVACAPTPVPVEPIDRSDRDGDGIPNETDCDPDDPSVYLEAPERCDGKDNDCNGVIDESFDADGDGFLVDSSDCRQLTAETDCDDDDALVHPGADEPCDGRDNDCSGWADDADEDGDNYSACEDCDDKDRYTNAGVPDVCDGLDNNCDGVVDPLFDEDGDGYSSCAGDCDEMDARRSPALPEICDGVDNNCADGIDEGFDQDGDGQTTCEGDCDDSNPAIYLGATEACDDVDTDCDALTGDRSDADGDSYTLCDGDCDDGDATAFPGNTERCDGQDNDCNDQVDEVAECYGCTNDLTGQYALCTVALDWASAEWVCQNAVGGHLVSIGDAEENTLIAEWVASTVAYYAWIGYNDTDSEGVFAWSSGEADTFSFWDSGQPDNAGNEDCVGIGLGDIYHWNDFPCDSWSLAFVCER